jgi:hypothetical protein
MVRRRPGSAAKPAAKVNEALGHVAPKSCMSSTPMARWSEVEPGLARGLSARRSGAQAKGVTGRDLVTGSANRTIA